MIRFGPAGLGGVRDAVKNLEHYASFGLKACEIAFTYGVYIKPFQKEVKEIRNAAKKLDIKLSIHAPYWINLNSPRKKVREESKKRILDCCRVGEVVGADCIVFHPGYYGKDDKEKTYQTIKREILDMSKEIKKNKWHVRLAPETTGKINVFGSEEEIKRLVRETSCFFTLDFAHVYAREQGKISYKEIYKPFKSFKELHCHFSGINFSSKGERNHKITSLKEWRELLNVLPKNKNITIINESPSPVKDAVKGLKIYNSM